ncbi:DUF305 domain-containing protein [Siccirubricoccus phaeus]|uniref:DUF305 domain-containing protein n=1 Tax=Siccirubricoccus phaeus TaxID=2595053 RepID=UPI00165B92A8|nr:DUF305 domain-containing protein [Siccirubricoccus phaeus]
MFTPTTRQGPAFRASLLALCLLALAPAARAAVEEDYTPGDTPAPTTWYGPADPAAEQADRAFVAGMRPHHEGALTMSRDYLADPAAGSPALRALAEAIIRNQRFEIAMLDAVARNLERPPLELSLGFWRLKLRPMATEGLAREHAFRKTPIPGPATPLAPVTARDVQFAKAMTIHHEAAVEMARAYQANPAGHNGYLALMSVDIVTDQTQEIALMRRAVDAYPGDAAAVMVDAAMIHGMEGMGHGGGQAVPMGHGGHGTPAGQGGQAGRAGPAPQGGHLGHGAPVAPSGHAGHGVPMGQGGRAGQTGRMPPSGHSSHGASMGQGDHGDRGASGGHIDHGAPMGQGSSHARPTAPAPQGGQEDHGAPAVPAHGADGSRR